MYFSETYTIFFYIASFIFHTSSKCGRFLCPTCIIPEFLTADAAANFQLITGHDFLVANLYRLILSIPSVCLVQRR